MNNEEYLTKPKSEWIALEEIAAKSARLVAAITSRMSAGPDADGELVWRLFNAHRECVEALKHLPKK